MDFGLIPVGWAVGKKVWADYEQLLREVSSTFCRFMWAKKNIFFFENIVASELKRCIEKRYKKYFYVGKFFYFRKNRVFLDQKCHSKYIEVANRLLLAIL